MELRSNEVVARTFTGVSEGTFTRLFRLSRIFTSGYTHMTSVPASSRRERRT